MNAEFPSSVAIHFKELNLQHHLATRFFHLPDQLSGNGQTLRRVANGNGAAARVQLDVGGPGHLPQNAEHLRHVFRAGGAGKRKSLLGFRGILPALLQGVRRDEDESRIHRAPERRRLCAQDRNGREKIHIVEAKAYRSRT